MAIVCAAITACAAIIAAVINLQGGPTINVFAGSAPTPSESSASPLKVSTAARTPSAVASAASTATPVTSTPGVTTSALAPVTSASTLFSMTFVKPPNWEAEGKVVGVTLNGVLPRGEHLWIFVYHAEHYYVQGAPFSKGFNLWYLPGVNLGSSFLASDINSWYVVYAVQANSQANKLIQAEYNNQYDVNYGVAVIPGGSGAEKIAHMDLYRNH